MRFYLKLAIVLLLLFEMEHGFTSPYLHEIGGVIFLVLVAVHVIINQERLHTPFTLFYAEDNYRLMTLFVYAMNLSLLVSIIFLAVSGIYISETLFDFPENPLAYRVHILSAYWTFILTGVHMGVYLIPIVSTIFDPDNYNPDSVVRAILIIIFVFTLGVYGAGIFLVSDFPFELFMIDREALINIFATPFIALFNNVSILAFWVMFGYQSCAHLGKQPSNL